MKIHLVVKYLLLLYGLCVASLLLAQKTETEIDQIYQGAKLEVLCKALDFMLNETVESSKAVNLDCSTLATLKASIPEDTPEALRIFTIFEKLLYKSYGKDKLQQRTDKLLKDLETELRKSRKDAAWRDNVNALMLGLKIIKNDYIRDWGKNKLKPNKQQNTATSNEDRLTTNFNTKKPYQITTPMWIVIIIMFLLSLAGMYFLYKQNQDLKTLLNEQEENLIEKYVRVDNRIDTMTPSKDFQALLLKFNFLNEQLTALIKEVQILQKRNQHKMSAEELYAKRTEHLESYNFNPNLQIYFAKIRPNSLAFEMGDFKTEPSRDSIYKIEINLQSPNQAVFSILGRSEYHQLALTHHDKMLAPACQYANEPYNDSRITTLENGIIEKKDEKWVILKKAKIAFE